MHKIQINVLILQLRNLSVLSLLTKQIGSGPVTYAKNKQKILIYTKIKQNKENRPSCVVQRMAGRIRLVTQPQLDLPGFMPGFSSGTRCKPHKTTVSLTAGIFIKSQCFCPSNLHWLYILTRHLSSAKKHNSEILVTDKLRSD